MARWNSEKSITPSPLRSISRMMLSTERPSINLAMWGRVSNSSTSLRSRRPLPSLSNEAKTTASSDEVTPRCARKSFAMKSEYWTVPSFPASAEMMRSTSAVSKPSDANATLASSSRTNPSLSRSRLWNVSLRQRICPKFCSLRSSWATKFWMLFFAAACFKANKPSALSGTPRCSKASKKLLLSNAFADGLWRKLLLAMHSVSSRSPDGSPVQSMGMWIVFARILMYGGASSVRNGPPVFPMKTDQKSMASEKMSPFGVHKRRSQTSGGM
mmetsp:Transcript_86615/g.242628  ORF Transcript_86615/g.242628 Transcript_86615/m.242628 type:complete len:271 (-) Transcript_86615:926-1738(-)